MRCFPHLPLILPAVIFLLNLSKAEDTDDKQLVLQALLDGQRNILAKIEALQTKQILMKDQQRSSNEEIAMLRNMLVTDECKEGHHNCSEFATCIDTCGHYRCSCFPGYSGDGVTCQDIDECVEGTHSCGLGSNCINEPGDFHCICEDGFEKDQNDICQDINECERGSDECDSNATCINNIGSYTCNCNDYYSGDGYSCAGPNCITPFVAISGLGCMHVEKTLANWQQAKETCHQFGGQFMEGITPEILQLLKKAYGDDRSVEYVLWIGVKNGIWITNKQPIPEELWGLSYINRRTTACGAVDSGGAYVTPALCHKKAFSLCQQLK